MGDFLTSGRNLNISSQVIFLQGYVGTNPSTNSTNEKSGNINLLAQGNIVSQSSIFSGSTFGDSGNIKIQAGGTVNIQEVSTQNLQANAGSISIKAGGEIKTRYIYSGIYFSSETSDDVFYAGSGKAGNVDIVSQNNVIIQNDLISSSSQGTGGNISVTAQGDINIQSGSIYTGTDNGNAGSVTLNALGDILTRYIDASSRESGIGGTVKLTSEIGKIDINGLGIDTYAKKGNAGSVTLNASEDILANYIDASSREVGISGTVRLTSETGKIDGQGIDTYAQNGNAGKVILNAVGDITSGSISTRSNSMSAGSIQVTSKEGNIDLGQNWVQANSTQGNGANITLTANLITAGSIDSGANGNGSGGNIKLSTKGDILTSTIVTNSNGQGYFILVESLIR